VHARSRAPHIFDLAWRLTGEPKPAFDCQSVDKPGTMDGYEMLRKVRAENIPVEQGAESAGDQGRTTRR
jgi:hypothetical protein